MSNNRQIQIGGDGEGNTLITGDGNVVIIETTRRIEAEKTSETPTIGANPYQGLAAFTENEADRLFGRENLTLHLWEDFRSLHEPKPGGPVPLRILPILGPSGSGKSSVARAGLIPELARRPLPGLKSHRVAVVTPGAHPLEALAGILARIATKDQTPVAKTREFAQELRQTNTKGDHDGLRRIAEVLPEIEVSPLIVLIDQFEELYSLCEDTDERDIFVKNLLHAAADRAGRVSIILTMRSDFLGHTQAHPGLNHAIADRAIIVPAMDEEQLRRAIAEPASHAGHPLDTATVDLLITETLGREGALPLLQFSLTRIWEGMAGGIEPAETLRQIGGVGGALAEVAQRFFESLSDTDKSIARRAFLGLIRLGEGTQDTRRRIGVADLVAHGEDPGHVHDVLSIFCRPGARLITLSADPGGADTADVTHEALFEHWGLLKMWLDTSRDDLRFHRRLEAAVTRWYEQGRPDGSLWRPPDLDLLKVFHKRASINMSETQIAFFRASVRKQQQSSWLKWSVAALLVILTAIAVMLALKATQEQEISRARELAAHAMLAIKTDPTRGFRLTEESLKILPTSFAERALLEAYSYPMHNTLRGHTGEVTSASFSPDGKYVVTGSQDKTARIWDAASGQEVHTLKGHTGEVTSASFSPDGKYVVTAGYWDMSAENWVKDTTVRIWDAASGQEVHTLRGHTAVITSASFSPDGKYVVTGSWDKTARIWDAASGQQVHTLRGHTDIVDSASFSPDSKYVVTGSRDYTVRIWDAASGQQVHTLRGHTNNVSSASFSPDGKYILTISWDSTERIWDVASGQDVHTLRGSTDLVIPASFSPDGKYVVATGGRSVRIWDAATGQEVHTLTNLMYNVSSASFSPDGTYVVITGSEDYNTPDWNTSDQTVRIWDVASRQEIHTLSGHSRQIISVSFSPDGKYVVTGSQDNTARIWDAARGQQVHTLRGHTGYVSSASFSPDGKYVVTTGSADRTARIWDAASGQEVHTLTGHLGEVTSSSFSPDGKYVVTGSRDNTARIWDAASGQLVNTLRGHTDLVTSASFSPDGKYVVTGSWDDTARIWPVDYETILKLINKEKVRGTVRGLTEKEQKQYRLIRE